MKVIWQCKNCDGGPCQVCAPNQSCSGSAYDPGGALAPLVCPYSPHFETAEFEAMPTYSITNSPFDSLMEWLNSDEGYDHCSEPLRDAIFSQWFDPSYDPVEGQICARRALMELESCQGATWTIDWDDIQKTIKKADKLKLAAMAWSRGFQAGLMYAERLRLKMEEKAKDGWKIA